MFRKKYYPENPEAVDDPFQASISDLMASLLSIFILAFIYYILNFQQATAQLSENQSKRTEILLAVQRELKQKDVDAIIDIEHGVLRLPEGVLFDTGEARLKESGIATAGILGPILENVLNRPEFADSVDTIFIEGHTDDLPIHTALFSSNWELSTQRAINTFHALTDAATGLKQFTNSKREPVLSCSGYADTRPLQPNTTEKNRRENRRIDFRFSMTPPTEDDAGILRPANR
ncbi:flagellar motor protein MotB [Acetonema longum]|uniref:OmpA/MotB domain protein n=1 Tax=Acetonema longum DSM 6540 TaxID=1009370 RepID=F7NEZ7_9FIRM|nr:OmpA family protein [Acetonema longum]EGO65558.1 OmpA/MotB domain protein [Acetonema longum DSM 6540]